MCSFYPYLHSWFGSAQNSRLEMLFFLNLKDIFPLSSSFWSYCWGIQSYFDSLSFVFCSPLPSLEKYRIVSFSPVWEFSNDALVWAYFLYLRWVRKYRIARKPTQQYLA